MPNKSVKLNATKLKPSKNSKKTSLSASLKGADKSITNDVWQAAIWIIQQGGDVMCQALMAAMPSTSALPPKRQQTVLQQWLCQHLFTLSQDGSMVNIDSALSLRRLTKYAAFDPAHSARKSVMRHKGSKKNNRSKLLSELIYKNANGKMTWSQMEYGDIDDDKALTTTLAKKSQLKPKSNKSHVASLSTPIPFMVNKNYPFLLGDVVLGVVRNATSRDGSSKSRTRTTVATEPTFEPLYLVFRVQTRLTAYLLDGRIPKVSLVLGRKEWLMPIVNREAISKTVLNHKGLVEVSVLPERGFIQQAHAQVKYIGEVTDSDPETLTAILEHHLPHEFSYEITKATKEYTVPTLSETNVQGVLREDLRHLPIITIDGEDAKDFDDAVWAKDLGNGYHTLIVAIADVSHYVREGTELNAAAFERGTSVYFPRRVIPMLPPELSEVLCSLRPNQDRAALCVEMKVSNKGEIAEYRFFASLIKSQARMTYHEVEALMFSNNKTLASTAKNLSYPKKVMENLCALKSVYTSFSYARANRGALELDSREWKFRFDGGRVIEVFQTERLLSHRLIEECMIAANVCAAGFLNKHKEALLYRVHEKPLPEKVAILHETMISQGFDWTPSEPISTKSLSHLLALLREEKAKSDDDINIARFDSLQMSVLRTLKQAQYTPINLGHFGLGLSHYAHFTSPIRRYPDLLVHRGIMNVLGRLAKVIADKNKDDENTINQTYPEQTASQDFNWLGLYSTQCEKRADDATRAAASQLRCELTVPMIGQRVDGLITGVAAFGIFVQLPISMADGLLPMRVLGNALGEYLEFDAEHQRIFAPRQQISFGVGEKIQVLVQSVIPHQRKIDLGFCRAD